MKKVLRIFAAATAILTIGFTVVFFLKKQPVYSTVEKVNLCKVQKSDLENSIYINVAVVSDNAEQVYSYVDAPAGNVKVKIGDTVRKGDIICDFDCTDLQKEYDSYMLILEQLIELDSLYSDSFESNALLEKSILESQVNQLNTTIGNYQKKYEETLLMAEDYHSLYESAADEQENLRIKIESLENNSEENVSDRITVENTSVEITEEMISEENTDVNTSDQIKYVTDNLRNLYNITVQKKDRLYDKYLEMKRKAEDIGVTIESYREDLKLLMAGSEAQTAETEIYYTPESRDNLIASYTEKTDKLQKMLDNSTVTADRDGIITDLYVTSGEYVSEGLICCIQNPDKLYFKGYVTPENLSDISGESRIMVNLFDGIYTENEGKNLFINDCFDEENNGYEISFTIDGIENHELYPGHEVSARIVLESQQDTLTVPYDAIFETDGQTYVRRYSESGDYKDVKVKKGLETSYYVAVDSDELSENDLVATEMLK